MRMRSEISKLNGIRCTSHQVNTTMKMWSANQKNPRVGFILGVFSLLLAMLPNTGACFHGNGTVLLQSGATKPFSELIIGEFIKTYDAEGKLSFSPIKTLPHANNNEPAAFLALKTETGKEVEMTSDHFIPKCNLTVVTAGELVVGDCLLTSHGNETLMEISWAEKYGVYTAVTGDEFVVVNGIVASAFSKESRPRELERELDYKKYSMELERMKSSKFAHLSRKATKLKE